MCNQPSRKLGLRRRIDMTSTDQLTDCGQFLDSKETDYCGLNILRRAFGPPHSHCGPLHCRGGSYAYVENASIIRATRTSVIDCRRRHGRGVSGFFGAAIQVSVCLSPTVARSVRGLMSGSQSLRETVYGPQSITRIVGSESAMCQNNSRTARRYLT